MTEYFAWNISVWDGDEELSPTQVDLKSLAV